MYLSPIERIKPNDILERKKDIINLELKSSDYTTLSSKLTTYNSLLENNPNDEETLITKALLLYRVAFRHNKQDGPDGPALQEALEILHNLIETNRFCAKAYFYVGYILIDMGYLNNKKYLRKNIKSETLEEGLKYFL